MADTFSREIRSKVMSKVRGRNTAPELLVRSLLHKLGYRYRIHDKSLPGTPDIVFHRRKAVIFIHGCFWHQHAGCPAASRPTSNTAYWNKKLDRNIQRDSLVQADYTAIGWKQLVIWECEIRNKAWLANQLQEFLGPVRWSLSK